MGNKRRSCKKNCNISVVFPDTRASFYAKLKKKQTLKGLDSGRVLTANEKKFFKTKSIKSLINPEVF